jgi:hypothetical protein
MYPGIDRPKEGLGKDAKVEEDEFEEDDQSL